MLGYQAAAGTLEQINSCDATNMTLAREAHVGLDVDKFATTTALLALGPAVAEVRRLQLELGKSKAASEDRLALLVRTSMISGATTQVGLLTGFVRVLCLLSASSTGS
jgi:hypothetical protein